MPTAGDETRAGVLYSERAHHASSMADIIPFDSTSSVRKRFRVGRRGWHSGVYAP